MINKIIKGKKFHLNKYIFQFVFTMIFALYGYWVL